jgi:hypothetical protein
MVDVASSLAGRDWLRRDWPFPHVVAWDVFRPEFYDALAGQMRGILARGLSETAARGRFSRSIPGYDAYGFSLDGATEGPLALFLSAEWRDLLADLFDVPMTPYVFAGAHHHTPRSASGNVHNDLNPGWFPRANGTAIQVPNNDVCNFRTGVGRLDDAAKIQVVRGVAMILFLLNDGWRPGDGGETGLYASRGSAARPAVRIPPRNNSLLAFECTPRSYHTFLSNCRLPRTSVIMWIHQPLETAIARHGADRLERWPE